MAKPRITAAVGLSLCAAFLFGSIAPAAARARVSGHINTWNLVTNRYEALQNARVRLVLAEYYDADTFDVEGSTDSSGYYNLSKGNAWWRSGYDAYLIIFAEVNNRLEVQSHYMQIDGYQAVSRGFFARDNNRTTIDVNIGGPSDNTRRYQVGGVAALNNSSNTSKTKGTRAFFICREMTDHRKRLINMAPSGGDFEEKEVSYPVSAPTASYVSILDYIRYPDRYFTDGDMPRASLACRHELSHGIMADEYWTWPGWMHGWMGSHTLGSVAERREFAWSEAWAEFMAEVTQSRRYGRYFDFESPDGSWRDEIPSGADRSYVEGELASVMWDIHDPTGWEKREEQVAAIPGNEMFFDGISDPDLTKIWHIFTRYHPHGVTHTSYIGSKDNFVHYWLNRTSFGQKHELKAILFNRNIHVPELPQSRPTLSLGNITWTGNTARIPVTVRETNPEDRTRVRLEFFINGAKVYSQWLTSGWSGSSNTTTVNQEVAWVAGDPRPQLLVAVHDDMQSSHTARTLDPPAGAQIGGLVAEILGVSIHRDLNMPSVAGVSVSGAELRNLVVNVRASDGQTAKTTRLPASGSWSIAGEGTIRYNQTPELFKSNSLTNYIELRFTSTGRDINNSINRTFTQRFTRAQNYGLGEHNDRVLNISNSRSVVFFRITSHVQVNVVYRIRALRPSVSHVVAKLVLDRILPMPIQGAAARARIPAPATRAGVIRRVPPGATMQTRQVETPSIMLAKSSQLMDQYARLQAEALEMADELEARLARGPSQSEVTPPKTKPPTIAPRRGLRMKPRTTRPAARTTGPTARVTGRTAKLAQPTATLAQATAAAGPTLLAPNLATSTGLLTLPDTPTLDKAVTGRLVVTKLTDEQRAHLQELRDGIAAREARLPQIEAESIRLKGSLNSAVAKLAQDELLEPRHLQAARADIQQMTTRLSAVAPSIQGYRSLLLRERQLIDKGLRLK